MKAWEEYAFISNGRVMNIAVFQIGGGGYTCANAIAKEQYGDSAIGVNVTQYKLSIGDLYENGKFYKNVSEVKGDEITAVPTDEEEIASLNDAVDDIVIEILGG